MIEDADVAQQLERFSPPTLDIADVETFRAVLGSYFHEIAVDAAAPLVRVPTEERSAPSLVDDHAIPVRVYRPAACTSSGALVYLHGGGFVFGDLEVEDTRCHTLAHEAGCVVVSVDYRLAPEHPFPVPLEDCYSALRWVADHADELAIDPSRLAVGGLSAGGALAASLAQVSRDRGGPPIALQLLVYPVLDTSGTWRAFELLLTPLERKNMRRMWRHYLNGAASHPPAYASPAACAQLDGLPPAHIVVGELDALRDEAIAYAQRLLDVGVSVELHVWPGARHAVDLFAPDARVSCASVSEQARAVARALAG